MLRYIHGGPCNAELTEVKGHRRSRRRSNVKFLLSIKKSSILFCVDSCKNNQPECATKSSRVSINVPVCSHIYVLWPLMVHVIREAIESTMVTVSEESFFKTSSDWSSWTRGVTTKPSWWRNDPKPTRTTTQRSIHGSANLRVWPNDGTVLSTGLA